MLASGGIYHSQTSLGVSRMDTPVEGSCVANLHETVHTVTHCQPPLSVFAGLNEKFIVGDKQYNIFNMATEQNGDRNNISQQAHIHPNNTS